MAKHILTGKELASNDINYILELALKIKARPDKYDQALAGKTLTMLFEKPSFRTRLSFALAITKLGGSYVESVGNTRKSEEPKDLMRVLNGYSDFVMVRTHEDSFLEEMASCAKIPLINGLTALYHPCQILADLLTLKEKFQQLEGLTITYIGDGNNILNTLLLMAPKMGITVKYFCPKNHGPNDKILSNATTSFSNLIHKSPSAEEAALNSHAVYTDVWTSMGFETKDEETFSGFQVNEALMLFARPNAIFLHCMPMERGKEVSNTLPDQPCSAIFEQSANRLHVQKAVLVFLAQN